MRNYPGMHRTICKRFARRWGWYGVSTFDIWITRFRGASNSERLPGELLRLQHTLKELGTLLASWSNTLSNTYFSHARNFPITMG